MKCFKFFAITTLLVVSTSAFAQSTTITNSSSTDGWTTIWVEWNPSTLKSDETGSDNTSFTGFSSGFSQAFSVSAPFFLEVGFGVQYIYGAEEYYASNMEEKISIHLITIKIPANLMYPYQLPNSSVLLIPFAGINIKYNVSGTAKWEYESRSSSEEKSIDLYNKRDMGSSSAIWKRRQLGWQIGVKARFNNNFLIGLSYGSDFSEIAQKTKFSTTSITVGCTF